MGYTVKNRRYKLKRRDFICSATCLIAGFGLGELKNRSREENDINPKLDEYYEDKRELNEIYIETTSHCNLNCKGCDAFSPLSKEEYVDYEDFSRDFHKLKELYPNKNIDILFLGGEPLLNPDLTKMIKLSHELFPNNHIVIMTNGILLDQMDEDFYNTVKKENVLIRITKHPIDIDRTAREKFLEKYGIKYEYNIIYSDRLYSLDTHKISKNGVKPELNKIDYDHECPHYWGKPIIDLSGSQDYIEKKYTCKHKENGFSYIRGNLYYCCIHAHINAFKDYFHLNIPITQDDYIKIAEVKNAEEINNFISTPKPLCRYCKQCHNICFGGKPFQWEFSKCDIKEWTL